METVIEMQEAEIARLKAENRSLKRRIKQLTGKKKVTWHCDYSGCHEWRGVKPFWSWEEGQVYLCRKHRAINEGKTGYTEQVRT